MDSPIAPITTPKPPTYAELKRSLSGLTYDDVRISAATYEALKYMEAI